MRQMSVKFAAAFMVTAAVLAGCGGEEKGKEAGEAAEAAEGATGRSIGTQQIGGYSVTVTQQSEFKPGAKAKFFVKPTGGTNEPTAVRAWYGVQSGEGSLKVKAGFDAADNDYDAVVEIPETPAADAKLWVEIEAAGTKNVGGFTVPK